MVGGVEGLNRDQEVSRRGTPFDNNNKIQSIPGLSQNVQIYNPKQIEEIKINQTEKIEEKQEERQERNLLQRVKEKMGIDNLETTSASDFMKSFNTLNGRQLSSFYVILQEDSTGTLSNYIKDKLSLEDKVKILEELDNGVISPDSNKSTDKFGDRNKLMLMLLDQKDQEDFKKKLILKKDKTDVDNQIETLERYFTVKDIITNGFGYDRNLVLKSFKDLALKDRKDNNQKYKRLTREDPEGKNQSGYINETVARFFMLKILDSGNILQEEIFERKDENGQTILNENKTNILWEYSKKGGVFLSLVNSLSSLKNDQLKKFNGLTDDGFIRVLENISNNVKTQEKINKMISYNVEKDKANEIAYLIDIENIVETQISDFVYFLKENGNLDKHQDYGQALEAAKQDFAKELFLSSRSNIDWDNLSFERKQVYIDKWNNLSKEQQDQRSSVRLVSLINNSSYSAVQSSARYSEMRQSEIAATRIIQTQSYLERNVSNMNLSEEEQSRLLSQISQQAENSNSQLFESAQINGFSEDLRQVRGDEYYKKVESEYRIISSTEMLDKKVDITTKAMTTDKESWNGFKDKIKENSALGENWIKEIKGLENDSLKEEEKNIVLESTNNQLKQTFVNRMLFFLQDSLDINIDSKNTENILSQFSLDKNQKFDNQSVLFKGAFNGQNIELKYDMKTGNLSYKPFLSKQQDSIGVFATDFVPFSKELIGPSIQEITSVCDQKINCKEILDKSENDMEKYSQIFGNELETKYPPKLVENKDSIKEDYLKTIIAQEMVDLTQETVLSMHIDSNNGKERYEFYKMIYTNVYQIEENNSINKLQELRENIKDMKNQYDKIKTSTIKEDFSFGPKPILKKLFDKTLVNKDQNIVNKDNKTAMWNRFFEDVSDKKNGKDVINSQKIKLFMKGVSSDQDKNKIVESVSESMKPFFDKELDAELIRQYNIA